MRDLPGTPFDVTDVRPCALCGRGVMLDGNVTFYEVAVAQCVADLRNIQRMHGLETMMGGHVGIARALSPDNTVARRLPPSRSLICLPCLTSNAALVALAEGETR